jgi:hypothetical protein
MFDHRFEAHWRAPDPKGVIHKDGVHSKKNLVDLQFQTEFTDDIAAGISEFAQQTRQALLNIETQSVPMKLDNVTAVVEVYTEDSVEPVCRFAVNGVTATAKVKKPEGDADPEPFVIIKMRTGRTDANWLQLGHLFGTRTEVVIRRAEQPSLDLEKGAD